MSMNITISGVLNANVLARYGGKVNKASVLPTEQLKAIAAAVDGKENKELIEAAATAESPSEILKLAGSKARTLSFAVPVDANGKRTVMLSAVAKVASTYQQAIRAAGGLPIKLAAATKDDSTCGVAFVNRYAAEAVQIAKDRELADILEIHAKGKGTKIS